MPECHVFNLNTHTFSNFYADDGLQGNEFSKNASFADHNGILWFGGTNGITYFNPQEITNPAKNGTYASSTSICTTSP